MAPSFRALEAVLGPILVTLLSLGLRIQNISIADRVVWDEAHFGKFGAYYLLHEFYFDVHPPLGKMLVALSGYLANFKGDFLFESGHLYPENVDFTTMRIFNAIFGALVTPLAYFTAKALGHSLWTVYLITLMVCAENIFVVLLKFILLDNMLLFFTAATILCLVKLHQHKTHGNILRTILWFILCGLSIGCVCSVKWVGLFVTSVVGMYTILDLFLQYLQDPPKKVYFFQWILRIFSLIVIPFSIYVASFKAHFALLNKTGTGHSSMSSLFQFKLENTDIKPSPRYVTLGSKVTLRSHGILSNLLHLHVQMYPEGLRQHQVTTYGYKDTNNDWVFAPSRLSGRNRVSAENDDVEFIWDGDRITLYHANLGCNLHSHEIGAHVTRGAFEVSGYGNAEIGDLKDDWIVEIVEQLNVDGENRTGEYLDTIHPILTNFRLRHAELGCYLATTGRLLPTWGFKQGEVVCRRSYFKRDKSTWWNVEDHYHPQLEPDLHFFENPPRSNFWRDFILLNFAMHASNNALVPDPDKFDNLASKWTDWLFARKGIRMSSWGAEEARYYMLPNPFTLWLTTACVFVAFFGLSYKVLQWLSQDISYDSDQNGAAFWDYTMKRLVPLGAWVMHLLPFVVMSRVTYVHHYVPAEYFAIFVAGDVIERGLIGITRAFEVGPKKAWVIRSLVYIVLYTAVYGVFQLFSPLCMGMEGHPHHYKYLRWLDSWSLYNE